MSLYEEFMNMLLKELKSIQKHDRKQPHYHPYAETGPGIDVEAYKKPKSLLPKGQKFLLDPSVKKHYTGPGGKHEHLPWGQVKVPKPKGASWESGKISRDPVTKKPGFWQGYIEKKDFQDLDFKDQDAVIAEREMLARKKPVIKPFIPVGGRKNIISTQKGKPGIFNEQIAASENKSLEKHEDFTMHGHAGLLEKKYPFLSHLISPAKIKTEPVKKIEKTRGFLTPKQREVEWKNPTLESLRSNKPVWRNPELESRRINKPAKIMEKDTSSISDIKIV